MDSTARKAKIIFLVLPKVHILDLAGPVQVFQEAIECGLDVSLEYCAGSSSIATSGDLPFGSLKHFSGVQVHRGDYLLVAGADLRYLLSKELTSQRDLKTWVKEAYEAGATVGSICTGAFFLAAAGLLNGRKCTTHWKRADELLKHYPLVHLKRDVLFTEDERIITSAGVTAGIDMALYIVSKLTDERFAYKVARELVVYMRRHAHDPQQSVFMQYRNHINSGIHKVQDYVQDNLEKGTALPQLSEVACMSTRNLTRTFKRETGITINEYLGLVRKERLKELIKSTDYTRKQMARYCGLKSERQVIRLLKEIRP